MKIDENLAGRRSETIMQSSLLASWKYVMRCSRQFKGELSYKGSYISEEPVNISLHPQSLILHLITIKTSHTKHWDISQCGFYL